MHAEQTADHPRDNANRQHRRVDRLEGLLTWLLCLLVISGVVIAFLVGASTRAGLLDRAETETRDRSAVDAVLVEDVPLAPSPNGSAARSVGVRWRGPDGVERTGTTIVTGSYRAGHLVRVWVGADGRLVKAPMTAVDATMVGVLTGLLVATVVGGVVAVLGQVMSGLTARAYARVWELEWQRVEPEWTGRQRS